MYGRQDCETKDPVPVSVREKLPRDLVRVPVQLVTVSVLHFVPRRVSVLVRVPVPVKVRVPLMSDLCLPVGGLFVLKTPNEKDQLYQIIFLWFS